MLFSDRGVVLKTTDVGEKDKILTLYTENHGVLSVYSSGSRVVKSKLLAASDLFCFAEFVIYTKDEKQYSIREAQLINCFYNVRMDLSSMALGNYICEIARVTGTSDVPDPLFLRLLLNSLYAIDSRKYPLAKIKAAFEIRTVSILGFCPDMAGCFQCGMEDDSTVLDVMDGKLVCSKCRKELENSLYFRAPEELEGHRSILTILGPDALCAWRYCIGCKLEHLLSFDLTTEQAQREFCRSAEVYILNQLECGLLALNFYRQVMSKDDLDHWKV
jgi:DNA repair protein RecO (recombination protein O)